MFVVKTVLLVGAAARLRLRDTAVPHHQILNNINQPTLWRTKSSK
jgi:hypothetical protein